MRGGPLAPLGKTPRSLEAHRLHSGRRASGMSGQGRENEARPRRFVVSSSVMAGARGLWRVEIPSGVGETPYRLGALLHDVSHPGANELTGVWIKENLKHLKLDRV